MKKRTENRRDGGREDRRGRGIKGYTIQRRQRSKDGLRGLEKLEK